jgi:hypothetical protein
MVSSGCGNHWFTTMKGSAYVVLEVEDKLVVSMNTILKVECIFCSCSCVHVVRLYLYILRLEKLSSIVRPDLLECQLLDET